MSSESLRSDLIAAVEEINARYRELEGESTRAAVILATCSLEDELAKLIRFKKFPRDCSDDTWDLIAGPTAPLGSLKHRANFGYALGLYGEKTREIIKQIGVVRNKFAHQTNARDFHHPAVMRETAKLDNNYIGSFECTPSVDAIIIRQQFLWMVHELEERLERIRGHIEELDGPMTPLP